MISANPCAGVTWKHAGGGTHRFLDGWEISMITEHYAEHFAGMWAMLMLYAGLRRGEALARQIYAAAHTSTLGSPSSMIASCPRQSIQRTPAGSAASTAMSAAHRID